MAVCGWRFKTPRKPETRNPQSAIIMRRYLGVVITFLLVLAVLIALSAAGNIELDRPYESEMQPIRSSYSTGPTGSRALYQFLEESGRPVERWRESYLSLEKKAAGALLIAIGPFQSEQSVSHREAGALQKWAAGGGNLLIVSRNPVAQFGDPVIHSEISAKNPPWNASPESLIDGRSDEMIMQPTDLTKNLQGLALSVLASRIRFYPPAAEQSEVDGPKGEPSIEPTPQESPSPSPTAPATEEGEFGPMLYAPVIHIGDKDGAILADFQYGKGRVVFLSDPFVFSNSGVARGSNLTLSLNLIDSLGAGENNEARRIIFDEFHHGYRSESNPLINYFRGTPMPWLVLQGVLLCLLLVYSYGKRFARPLPLPKTDRHSPLEFVSSMANLQQTAHARDLAIENIYPRFKASLCRRLGISSRSQTDEILAGLRRRGAPVSEIEVREILSAGELALKGERLDDSHLVKLVARMRRIIGRLEGRR
jgi:hypothetical protein